MLRGIGFNMGPLPDHLKVAVASGKGGTGKTTVAVSLALSAAATGRRVQYLDCDVEAPNGHIFLKPLVGRTLPVTVSLPQVNRERCNGCGFCAEVCEYNAIAVVKGEVLIFPELCRSCGACRLFCPQKAISEGSRSVGTIEMGRTESGVAFMRGLLDIGQVATPAVIAAVKEAAGDADISLLDCPPGVSCPVIEAVKDADVVILVTEPTPFGLHDLILAVEMTRALHLPFGVIINRYGTDHNETKTYCLREGIPLLATIPDDWRIAQAYAEGKSIFETLPEYGEVFPAAWRHTIALREAATL